MRLFELAYACRLYGGLTQFDSNYRLFLDRTGGELDFRDPEHLKVLLVWLNSWGCRQFAKKDHKVAAQSVLGWAERWESRLPNTSTTLDELRREEIQYAGAAFADLSNRVASKRSYVGALRDVTVGPTGAAKILFAARPEAFVPWDDAIRRELRMDTSASSYCAYLLRVQEQIRQLRKDAAKQGIGPEDIPSAVGRQDFPLPKLVDEYYWITISQRFPPLELEEIARWYRWSRELA